MASMIGSDLRMITFDLTKAGRRLEPAIFNGAHLFAQDEIPVRGQLQIKNGHLLCIRHSDVPIGLATLWDVHDCGKIFLPTTRLPERDKPYNLAVELARARLLRINHKREEWGMADPKLNEEHLEQIDNALDNFIKALCCLDEPQKAAQLADQALVLALKGGEAMTLAHAKIFLERRALAQGFGRHAFGCCLDPLRMKDLDYRNHVKENFHFVTIPISWRQLQPEEHKLQFELLDECVQWLNRNRIAVKVGPLVGFAPAYLPDWLYIWENDFEQVREMAYDFVTAVVNRYGSKVQAWDVISGMNAENCFKFTFEQIIEMTRSVALAAKRSSPRSLVLVEITEPWGEYYAQNQRTVPPIIYADMVGQSGVPFDGFGIKLRFGRGSAGMRARDLLDISSLLDRFAIFQKKVHLAAVQVPSEIDPRDANAKAPDPGYWQGPWKPDIQAQWLALIYQIALSKPFVETVTWNDLADNPKGILAAGGLMTQDLQPKPALLRLQQLKGRLVRSTPRPRPKTAP